MTTTKTVPALTVPGVSGLPRGTPFSVYQRGADTFEALRINGPVALHLDDGSAAEATVQALQVGALVDLITNFGPQSVYTAGRIYSPLTLIQALTDAGEGAVLDVTRLYTAVTVLLPVQIPAYPAA